MLNFKVVRLPLENLKSLERWSYGIRGSLDEETASLEISAGSISLFPVAKVWAMQEDDRTGEEKTSSQMNCDFSVTQRKSGNYSYSAIFPHPKKIMMNDDGFIKHLRWKHHFISIFIIQK